MDPLYDSLNEPSRCRCAMIDELHDKQRNVDRIDRLIRSADAMNTNR